jgi:hypothetical protein
LLRNCRVRPVINCNLSRKNWIQTVFLKEKLLVYFTEKKVMKFAQLCIYEDIDFLQLTFLISIAVFFYIDF